RIAVTPRTPTRPTHLPYATFFRSAGGPSKGRRRSAMRSCGGSERSEAFDPPGEADRGNRLGAAEPRQHAVIAAARDQFGRAAAARVMQAEHEAGIVVEPAAVSG